MTEDYIYQRDSSLNDTANESYVTAIDETQYLSVLESTTGESLLGTFSDVTLTNSKTVDEEASLDNDKLSLANENSAEQQQVIVFNVEGSDELYGIQLAEDEEGNIQKYQFKFRQTDQGSLEAMPETVQLLTGDDLMPVLPQKILSSSSLSSGDGKGESVETPEEGVSEKEEGDYRKFVKGEVIGSEEDEDNIMSNFESDVIEIHHENPENDGDIKPTLLSLVEGEDPKQSEVFNKNNYFPKIEIEEDDDEFNEGEEDNNEVDEEESPEFILEKENNYKCDNNEEGEEEEYEEILLDDSVDSELEKQLNDYQDLVEEQESDSDEYEVEEQEEIHISTDKVDDNNASESLLSSTSNVLRQPSDENVQKEAKKSSKVLCFIVPTPEKENMNTITVNTLNNCKTNPRSVLKPQFELKLVPQTHATQESEALKRFDRFERRYSRSKEALEAKQFNMFINKTTIPHVPDRQTRLPRKQKIKPVDNRREEEIIVKEVMVSSNGFVESVEERMRGSNKFEIVDCINLDDSDDENAKAAANKNNVIEIFSSDEENENAAVAKGTGEEKKNSSQEHSQDLDDITKSLSPKKLRCDNSNKTEVTCPHCPKTFPSQNSLKTHIQHHNLENRLQKRMIFQYQHKCSECQAPFKNSILLSKHVCPKKTNATTSKVTQATGAETAAARIKKYTCEKCQRSFKNPVLHNKHICEFKFTNNKYKCGICKLSFKDVEMLNWHKRRHVKESMVQVTSSVQVTPRKSLKRKVDLDEAGPSTARTPTSIKVVKKFTCKNCHEKFASMLLLQMHLIRNCLKPKTSLLQSGSNKKFKKCVECDITFNTISEYTKHQFEEHPLVCSKAKRKALAFPASSRLGKAIDNIRNQLTTTTANSKDGGEGSSSKRD